MDATYTRNLLRPGDDGYMYDRPVDFTSDERVCNEWDEDDAGTAP
jgi:hypothetical protein